MAEFCESGMKEEQRWSLKNSCMLLEGPVVCAGLSLAQASLAKRSPVMADPCVRLSFSNFSMVIGRTRVCAPTENGNGKFL